MALVKRLVKGLPLTFAEGDNNLVYLETLALNAATTGSNSFTGSQTITGSVIATGGFTGSLQGTASLALSASYALNSTSASHALNSNLLGGLPSSSFAPITGGLGYIQRNPAAIQTGTFWLNGSGSFFKNNASNALEVYVSNEGDNFKIVQIGTTLSSIQYAGNIKVGRIGNTSSIQIDGEAGLFINALGDYTSDHDYLVTWDSTSNIVGAIDATTFVPVTSSYALNATSASYALSSSYALSASYALNSTSASHALTASYVGILTQGITITGSIQGNVVALSIASNTASLNLSQANFYTLQLVQGTNTYINPSNIVPGLTTTLLLSTTGSATVSFPPTVLQPSGSSYTPTTTTGKDVLTFISFDNTNLYLATVKNLR